MESGRQLAIRTRFAVAGLVAIRRRVRYHLRYHGREVLGHVPRLFFLKSSHCRKVVEIPAASTNIRSKHVQHHLKARSHAGFLLWVAYNHL